MTILSVCQDVSVVLNQDDLSSVFTSTEPFAKELRTLANEAATAIAKAHDWQALTSLNTMAGDGSTTAFNLPSDYDRMPAKGAVMTTQFAMPLVKARDLDFWLDMQIRGVSGAPGYWIIIGGQMQVLPALGSDTSAKFYYVRNTIVRPSTGALKATFTADDDSFVLPERLIKLALIWRWRAQKRYEYAEDLRNYEIALSEEIARDKGSRTLVVGLTRIPVGAMPAYPGPLG
jgi:hypothetical protein